MALISYNKNSYTREWEIRFISISILRFRINFEKQKGVFHIFGIPVLFLNVTAKTIEKYAKSVCHFFPNHDLYICCYSGAGEVFQLALRLPKYIKNSQKKNPCIVCTNKKLEQVFRMAIGDKFPLYVLPDLRCQFIEKPFEINKKTIYVPLNRTYFTSVEQKILSGNYHYFDSLLPHLNKLSKESLPIIKNISNKVKDIRNKYTRIAFISPEADTLKELPIEYWQKVVSDLKNTGYKVFINAINNKYDDINAASTKDLSYQETLELCSQSDLLLGLRSGFLELALFMNSPKSIVIYNAFRDSCVTKLTSKQALNGFSLRKMPIQNSNKVIEILYDDYKEVDVLLDLIKKLVNKKF